MICVVCQHGGVSVEPIGEHYVARCLKCGCTGLARDTPKSALASWVEQGNAALRERYRPARGAARFYMWLKRKFA